MTGSSLEPQDPRLFFDWGSFSWYDDPSKLESAFATDLNGDGEMDKIELSEETLKETKTVIEDLILAAHNNAKIELKSKTTEEISKTTGGFGIPGFKWPL